MADMDSKTFGSRVYGGDRGSRDTEMLDFFPFSHAKNVSQRRMKTERNPMKSKILLAAPLLVGCFIASGIVVASLDAGSGRIRSDISPSSETSQENSALRSLALALSSGKEAMHPFRGSPSEKDPHK